MSRHPTRVAETHGPTQILLATIEGLEALLGTSCASFDVWKLGCLLASTSKAFYDAVRAYRLTLRKLGSTDQRWVLSGAAREKILGTSEMVLRVLGRDCPQLQSMHLQLLSGTSPLQLRTLLQKLPELEELDIFCDVDLMTVFTIARRCPLLKKLHLFAPSIVDLTGGIGALAMCSSLTHLKLHLCDAN